MADVLVQDSGVNQPINVPVNQLSGKLHYGSLWDKSSQQWVKENIINHGAIAAAYGNPELVKLANNLGMRLDDKTKDYLIQYYLQEKGSENAMARSLEFNKEQYASMVEGLRRAGLNPFLAIQGLNGANMMQGQSTASGLFTQDAASKRQSKASAYGSIIGSVLMALALVVAHAL